MNVYFSKVIKSGERQREFNFSCLSYGASLNYTIDVPDDKGNRIQFSMQRAENGEWKTVAASLPDWILEAEPALGAAIEENSPQKSSKR